LWAVRPVSRRGSREIDEPEQRASNAEQGINGSASPRLFGINEDALCNAIAAILAAFKPAAPAVTIMGPGFGRLA
jgi:hypothetical protein